VTAVKKAVIPAAGLGTRFLPVTKSMPKEMLPIIDKPVIHYVVEEAIASEIEDIIIITGRGKRAIEDYFDASPELEMHLERNGKVKQLNMVKEINSLPEIHYIRQKEPKGLGDAILRAEKHIGDEPFAVLLGDDIVRNKIPCTKQLIDIFERFGSTIIAVNHVPKEQVSRYGIIKGKKIEASIYEVEDLIEKPRINEAPSNLGAVGRYIFTPEIFDSLKKTQKGIGDEIQLTDAIKILIKSLKVYAYTFKGIRYDAGDKSGYVEAVIDYALQNEEIKERIMEHIESRFSRDERNHNQ
jgi:UTP--glucose-1-phosphate uridylyltransferase